MPARRRLSSRGARGLLWAAHPFSVAGTAREANSRLCWENRKGGDSVWEVFRREVRERIINLIRILIGARKFSWS